MALQTSVNNLGGSLGGSEAVYQLKTTLKLAGWDIPISSDGTNYDNTGVDQIGSAAEMDSPSAWFVVRAPAAMTPRRQFLFMRDSASPGTNRTWLGYVSAEDGFSGGSALVRATATDEMQLIGTGGSYAANYFPAAASYKYHVVADDASPFGWWMSVNINGTGLPAVAMAFDPLTANSYPATDDDPAVYYFSNSSPFTTGVMTMKGWFKKDLAGEAFVDMRPCHYEDSVGAFLAIPGSVGSNPYDGDDNHFPIPYARPAGMSTQVGWKGFGSMIRWLGSARSNLDTLATGGTRDKVVQGGIVLPWPNVIPSI
jgi:hypothetical protein